MMSPRAPGAAHDFMSTTEISSRGSDGSTGAAAGAIALCDGGVGVDGSGSACAACKSLATSAGDAGAASPGSAETRRTAFKSVSLASKSRSICSRDGLPVSAFTRPIRSSA